MEELKLHKLANDLTGLVFGRLTVIKPVAQTKWGNYKWLCSCTCGVEKVIVGGNLTSGTSKSCGCLSKELSLERFTQHGMTKTQEHYSWLDIKKRTTGKTEKYKRDYVDRGIGMHPDFESFDAFYKEIGPKPDDGQIWSVGRVKNNEGYTYGNIRWETPAQQSRNKTINRNNKTGIAGVYHDKHNNAVYASSSNLDGTYNRVRFSLSKYSLEEALLLATEERKRMIEELNRQGAGYSESHGCAK